MMPTYHELRRLSYCVRVAATKAALQEFRGLSIEAFAEQSAERLVFHLRASIMGQEGQVRVPCGPDGWWQTFRSLIGLSYRERMKTYEFNRLFPDVPADQARTFITVREVPDDPPA